MITGVGSRLESTKILIRIEHMNSEEKKSILKLCKHYSEIFHVERDKLTFINANEHEIKLKGDQQPVY